MEDAAAVPVEVIAPMETFVEVMDIIMDEAPEASGVTFDDESGCYLTFEPTNNGTLFTNWSHTRVPNAFAFFLPGKKVPGFKYKQKGGRDEIIRGMRGGVGQGGLTRYYIGWSHFIKLAKEYKGTLTILHNQDLDLFSHVTSSGAVAPLPFFEPIDTASFDGVAVLPKANAAFNGVETMTRDYFVGTGNKEGAALYMK